MLVHRLGVVVIVVMIVMRIRIVEINPRFFARVGMSLSHFVGMRIGYRNHTPEDPGDHAEKQQDYDRQPHAGRESRPYSPDSRKKVLDA